MNTREKLLLLWALTATVLLGVGGVVLWQMLQPRFADSLRVGVVTDFDIGAPRLFECDRAAGRCTERTGFTSNASDFTPGSPYAETAEMVRVWLIRSDAETWRALIATSPHHGCFVNWFQDKERFEEGCYGSRWTRDGAYQEGPSPRGLDSFRVRIVNDEVWIDFQVVRGKNHD